MIGVEETYLLYLWTTWTKERHMRTALLTAILVLMPCAAMAFSRKEFVRSVDVKNGTSLKVDVLIKGISPSGGNFGQQQATLEAGESRTFRIRDDLPLTVSVSADNGLSVTRVFSADEVQGPHNGFLIALDSQGNLQLFGPDDPRPEEPPPDDPPPSVSPPTASLSRESLLAALWSSGLLSLAVVGLLINRHE